MPFSLRIHRTIAAALLCLLALAGCNSSAGQPPRPNGIALAPDGSIYVMALGDHRVLQLSPEGRQLSAFGKLGDGPSDIYEGWGTALDPAGNIYLCHRWRDEETGLDRESVKVFTPRGRLLREIPTPGDDGPEGCYSVRVDGEGHLFAVYSDSNRVRVFDAEGELLTTLWGKTGTGPGQFQGLRDVAFDPQRNLLYASDAANSRIQQFSLGAGAAGEIIAVHRLSFGSYGSELGQLAYPQYLAVDPASGNLAVGDMANRRVQLFDATGQSLAGFAPPDVADWQVMGLAFAADGALYAADALNGVIWVFEPDGRVRGTIEVPS